MNRLEVTRKKEHVAVIFACYNPVSASIANIIEASRFADTVVVIDDGSLSEKKSLYAPLADLGNVIVIESKTNHGIAHSLNVGFLYAIRNGFEWAITFDQDTTIANNLIGTLCDAAFALDSARRPWGIIAPGQVGGMSYQRSRLGTVIEECPEVIQSAAIVKLSALMAIGLVDESLVIDCVDTELCLRMRRHGYPVWILPEISIEHTIGTGGSVKILGRTVSLTHHSPERRYYMTRNRIRVLREYALTEPGWALIAARRLLIGTLLAVTVEQSRVRKLRHILAGAIHGLTGISGPRLAHEGPKPESVSEETIAVVLTLHNGLPHLGQQIASILTQTRAPDCLVVVDDKSRDNSVSAIVEALGENPLAMSVHLMRSASASRNTLERVRANNALGLTVARAHSMIAFSDQDDVWDTERLRAQSSSLAESGAAAIIGGAEIISEDGSATGESLFGSFPVPFDWNQMPKPMQLEYLLNNPVATGATMMVTSELVDSSTPIPRFWLHDRWLSFTATVGGGLHVDRDPVIKYRVHADQTVGLAGAAADGIRRSRRRLFKLPVVSAKKVIDLNRKLRPLAVDVDIVKMLSFKSVVTRYLGP